MKSICITGATQPTLDYVADVLSRAGMAAAKPVQRDEPVDPAFWHEQVLAMAADDAEAAQPISSPGRLWEQLASELFLANLRSKVWGWADARSIWLLDFWLEFEPRLNFILVCQSPEQKLAQAMASGDADLSVETILDSWHAHHQELLRFHHRNPQRSLLVSAADCAAHPAALIERCTEQWKLPLRLGDGPAPARPVDVPLALYLAQQLCRAHPQVAGLQNELKATMTRLVEGDVDTAAEATLAADDILASFRELHDRSREAQQNQDLREELAAALQEGEARRIYIEGLSQAAAAMEQEMFVLAQARDDEQSRHAAWLQSQFEQVADANSTLEQEKSVLEAERARLEGANDALALARDEQSKLAADRQEELDQQAKENELLLLQLQQVQEELESIFLDGASKQSQIDSLVREKAALEQETTVLSQARDEQAALVVERQQQIDALAQASTRLEQDMVTLAAQCNALESQVETLSSERDAAARQAAELLQTKLRDAEQESELLLLQLHQVQDELEHYYLKTQDLQNQAAEAETRWQRMFRRNPDYIDFDTLDATPGDQPNALQWRVTNLGAAGRTLAELEFGTVVEHDFAGFVLARQPGTTGPLLRWPACVAKHDELTVLPLGNKQQAPLRLEILLDLSTSDWNLVQLLTRLLDDALADPAALRLPAELAVDALRGGLGRLASVLAKFPATVRFDRVSLKREQANPDYEHLWLQFENLSFGAQRWPAFEFRLSCANVRPGQFGGHPKLEFPEATGQAPFEAWFAESYDDYGAKLELRFSMPESMDLGVWLRLSEQDRAFMTSLIKRLPAILAGLQASGVQIRRAWNDWMTMALGMQRVLAVRTAPPPKAPAPVPVESVAQATPPAPVPVASAKPETAVVASTLASPTPQPVAQTVAPAPAKPVAKAASRRGKSPKAAAAVPVQPAVEAPTAPEPKALRARRPSKAK